MKNKIIKDALALTLITLVAGVALGGVYEITKDPIAKQEAQAKAEAYEQVFTDAAAFEAVEMDDTLTKTIRDQLDQEGYKAQSIEEVMRAEDQSGETLGYAFTVVTSEGYGGDIQFSMGVQNDGIDPVHRRDRRAWYECRYSCFQRSVRRKTGRKTTVYKKRGNTG